jgi:hypothetical protein
MPANGSTGPSPHGAWPRGRLLRQLESWTVPLAARCSCLCTQKSGETEARGRGTPAQNAAGSAAMASGLSPQCDLSASGSIRAHLCWNPGVSIRPAAAFSGRAPTAGRRSHEVGYQATAGDRDLRLGDRNGYGRCPGAGWSGLSRSWPVAMAARPGGCLGSAAARPSQLPLCSGRRARRGSGSIASKRRTARSWRTGSFRSTRHARSR